ncbi:MAG TPA: hypothetical protein VGQ20_01215 [Acidimicrobiales bacterium]|jgi:hypothetical protein|nr:hypothetical protein [Acidimicrobiales bacterium]
MRAIAIPVLEDHTRRLRLRRVLTVLGLEPARYDALRESLPPGALVITAANLPEPDPARRTRAIVEAERRARHMEKRRVRLAADLVALDERLRAAASAVAEAEHAQRAADELARATTAALAQAQDELGRAEQTRVAATEESQRADRWASTISEVRADLERLFDGRRTQGVVTSVDADKLDGILARLAPHDIGAHPRKVLRAWTEAVRSGTAPCEPNAQALIDREADLDRRAKTSVAPDEDEAVVAATARVHALDALISQLKATIRDGDLSDDARAAIEAAHSRAVGGKRGVGRTHTDEATAAEAALLARHGFDSYLEYSIAISTGVLTDHAHRKLSLVTADRIEASAAHARARQEAEAREEALRRDRAAFDRDVIAYLGHRPDGAAAVELRTHLDTPTAVPALMADVTEADLLAAAHAATARGDLDAADARVVAATEAMRAAEEATARAAAGAAEAATDAEGARTDLASIEPHVATTSAALDAATAQHAELRTACDDLHAATLMDDDIEAQFAALCEFLPTGPRGEGDVAVVLDACRAIGSTGTIAVLERVAAQPLTRRVLYVTSDATVLEWARKRARRRAGCADMRGAVRHRRWR